MKKTVGLALTCVFASYLAFALTGKDSSLSSFIKSAVSSAGQVFDSGKTKHEKSMVSASSSYNSATDAEDVSALGELWGYYSGDLGDFEPMEFSIYGQGSISVGMVVDSSPGHFITAVNVPILSTNASNVTVGICSVDDKNTPLVTKSVDNVSVGYNTVILDKPIELPSTGKCFVYYSYEVSGETTVSYNEKLAIFSADYGSDKCYVKRDQAYDWNSYSYNASALQVYISSPAYKVYNEDFASWTSDNHDPYSSSENTWQLDCRPNTTLMFDYTVSSRSGYDFFYVYLDDEIILSESGEKSGNITLMISDSGNHVLRAKYYKSGYPSEGSDNASVKNIKLCRAEINADYLSFLVQNNIEGVQKKYEQLSGFDAIIAQLEAAIAELNALVDATEEQSVVINKVDELNALANSAIEIKDKYDKLSDVVKQHKEIHTVTGNEELGNVIAQAEAVINAKATLTTESSGDMENAMQAILAVADGMNLSDFKVWDFNISQKTVAALQEDGEWTDNGNCFELRRYYSYDQMGQMTYVSNYESYVIPETEGIYFKANGRYWCIYKDGTNRICSGYSGENSAFMLKDLVKGQIVTINYSTGSEGYIAGINRLSDNTTLVSGEDRVATGSAEVSYQVTSDGDAIFYPYHNNIYINSISLSIPSNSLLLASLRKEVADLIATLDEFPGLKKELQLVYDNAVLPEDGADAAGIINNLKSVKRDVMKAVEIYPILLEDIEAANAALQEGAYVDISEALALGNAVVVNLSVSADYIAAFEALETALAVYRSDKVAMDDWLFNTGSVCVVDGLRYYLDTTNNLAEFIGFSEEDAYSGALKIPATIRYEGTPYAVVKMIQTERYVLQRKITSVTLPKSLRQIGDNGLARLLNVRSIEIPENVTSMGSDVFYYSDNLVNIKMKAVVPPSVSGSMGGSSRKKISVPTESFHVYRIADTWKDNILIGGDGVTVSTGLISAGDLGHVVLAEAAYLQEVNRLIIDEGTLNNDDWNSIKLMTNLIEVDMSGVAMSSLPDEAFYRRWAIADIKLPHNVKSIGNRALRGTGVSQLTLPETVTTLGYDAFMDCDSLREINLPQSISAIPDYCFKGCKSLDKVTLPSGLTSLGYEAFRYCPIKTIDIPAGITVIKDGAFKENSAIDSLFIPETVTTIESNAFAYCESLQNVTFSEGLVKMYGNSFQECGNLTEIVLPSSLEICEDGPFRRCNGIKKLEARSVTPPTTRGVCPLDGRDVNDVVLCVPSWSTGEYSLAGGWSSFYTIETTDYMPQYIKVNKDFYFAVRDAVSPDYRPNISMTYSEVQSSDSYGHDNYERGNLTISGRSKLAVNNMSLVVSPFAKYYSDRNVAEGRDYDYHKTHLNSTSLIVNGEMRAENVSMELNNYNNRWQFVTFPFDVKVSDIVPQEEGTSWVIRAHDGAMRAAGNSDSVWVNLTADDVLEAGKGYIMHNSKYQKDNSWFWVYPLKNSVNRQLIFSAEDRTIELEENLSEFDHNRSWNLIGNPYPCFYDTRFMEFDAPFLVWDSYNRNYVAFNPADDAYILSPGEAFFLQRPFEQESITFRKEGRQTHRYARDLSLVASARAKASNSNARTIFNLTLKQDSITDRTRVVFNDAAALTYEMSRDAAKFAGAERNVPQIFTVVDKTRYAINERPFMTGDVALGVYCNVDGEYTISLDKTSGCRLVLEDRFANKFVELTDDNSYTFSAFAGEHLTRFVLHFGNNVTGVENVNEDAANADEAIYNLQGIKLDNTSGKGVYIKNGKKSIF